MSNNNTATVWETSSITMRATRRGINKYCSHSGTVMNSRGGIGGRVILVKYKHCNKKVLLLWERECNNNSMELDNNKNNSSKREKKGLIIMTIMTIIMRGMMINSN